MYQQLGTYLYDTYMYYIIQVLYPMGPIASALLISQLIVVMEVGSLQICLSNCLFWY